jgi:integrase
MLIGPDGLPHFDATVFTIAELRARNRAANTLGNCLRALIVLFLFLATRKIDLEGLLSNARALSLSQIEDLVRFSKLPMEAIYASQLKTSTEKRTNKVASLEAHRARIQSKPNAKIAPLSTACRLYDIRDYLRWRVVVKQSNPGISAQNRAALSSAGLQMDHAINARIPKGFKKKKKREGLNEQLVERMMSVIDPESSENPWIEAHSKERNSLAVHSLYGIGMRRGELLGVRIRDIDFASGILSIIRRADDSEDPRIYQPNAKTRERDVPLSPGLLDMHADYIVNHRSKIPGTKHHDFLYVASDTGAPLSLPAFSKVFDVLRTKIPDLPDDLTAHLLRYTWNDLFSEEMEEQKVPEDQEKKLRSYLMGWSETSGSAAVYTRRYIRKKAQRHSIEMQKRTFKKGKTNA